MYPARRPRPFLAALLSALIPGLGQWYAGARRRARPYLLVTVCLVLPAAFLYLMVFYVSGIGFALTLSRPFFDHPTLLGVLLVANAALLVFRAAAVVDAFLVARGPRRGPAPGLPVLVGLAFLLFLTAVPHGWVGHRNLLLYDLMTHDFTADPDQVGIGDVTTTTDPTGTAATTIPISTTTTLSDAFPEEGRVNVLLMGGDSGSDRQGIRTDTMVVVSIDPQTGWTAMFSLPRNLRRVPLPPDMGVENWWGDTCPGCYPQILNLLYGDGLARPDLWGGPNSGANAMKATIGHLLGIDVHYFALVDMAGFVAIVDAIGGIDIEVPTRVYDSAYRFDPDEPTEVLDIQPGLQHMDGRTALAYARSREGSNDFDRMSRQRCVLQAIASQTDPVTALREFPSLVPVIEENVFTDIPVSAIPDFIGLLDKFVPEEVVSVRYMPDAPEFAGTATSYIADWTEDRYPIPDRDFIAERTGIALSLPPLEAIAALGLQKVQDVCTLAGG